MITVQEILSLYYRGALTDSGLYQDLASLVSRANIDSVMSEIPNELLPGFRDWAFKTRWRGPITFGRPVSEEAILALREWLGSRS